MVYEAFKTPKSWTFENDKQFKKYRLNITDINDDPQSLMQISELQIWGVPGDQSLIDSCLISPGQGK